MVSDKFGRLCHQTGKEKSHGSEGFWIHRMGLQRSKVVNEAVSGHSQPVILPGCSIVSIGITAANSPLWIPAVALRNLSKVVVEHREGIF